MLAAIARLLTDGSDLLGAEVRLAAARLAKVAAAGALFFLLAILAAVGALALAAGAAGAMAPSLGWPAAIAIVGGGTILLAALCALGVIALVRRVLHPVARPDPVAGAPKNPPPKPESSPDATGAADVAEARREVAAARKRLHRALNAGKPRSSGAASAQALPLQAFRAAIQNPEAVAAGAFALASVIGPTRVFRVVTRTAGVVSMAATLTRIVRRELGALERAAAPAGSHNGSPRWSSS